MQRAHRGAPQGIGHGLLPLRRSPDQKHREAGIGIAAQQIGLCRQRAEPLGEFTDKAIGSRGFGQPSHLIEILNPEQQQSQGSMGAPGPLELLLTEHLE